MASKSHLQIAATAAEARAIAKDAYIYGYPMVQTYLTMYAFSIDKHNPQYKGPFNAPLSFARVFTPNDSAHGPEFDRVRTVVPSRRTLHKRNDGKLSPVIHQ
jgi:hypothetical protein